GDHAEVRGRGERAVLDLPQERGAVVAAPEDVGVSVVVRVGGTDDGPRVVEGAEAVARGGPTRAVQDLDDDCVVAAVPVEDVGQTITVEVGDRDRASGRRTRRGIPPRGQRQAHGGCHHKLSQHHGKKPPDVVWTRGAARRQGALTSVGTRGGEVPPERSIGSIGRQTLRPSRRSDVYPQWSVPQSVRFL